jgi:adenosylcobinamide-phosphate synthase
MNASLVFLALPYLVDLLVGDPRWIPHPVVWIGTCISALDRLLQKHKWSKIAGRLAGCLFPLLIVGGVFLLAWGLVALAFRVSPWVGWTLQVWLISTTIATKGLAEAGRGVYDALRAGDLPLSRQRLSWIVGRDTAHLEEKEIARGGIETVAENIVDAVTAPLFFAFLGGAPLALAYRAANTLDSMVGYKNDKHLHLGWASARLDDVANYIPARLTLPFLVFSAWILKYNCRSTWDISRRDASVHPSPNSGIAEAAVAGALGIRLGGYNTYHGVTSLRAYMGDLKEEIAAKHIAQTIRMLYATTAMYTLFLVLARALWR